MKQTDGNIHINFVHSHTALKVSNKYNIKSTKTELISYFIHFILSPPILLICILCFRTKIIIGKRVVHCSALWFLVQEWISSCGIKEHQSDGLSTGVCFSDCSSKFFSVIKETFVLFLLFLEDVLNFLIWNTEKRNLWGYSWEINIIVHQLSAQWYQNDTSLLCYCFTKFCCWWFRRK